VIEAAVHRRGDGREAAVRGQWDRGRTRISRTGRDDEKLVDLDELIRKISTTPTETTSSSGPVGRRSRRRKRRCRGRRAPRGRTTMTTIART